MAGYDWIFLIISDICRRSLNPFVTIRILHSISKVLIFVLEIAIFIIDGTNGFHSKLQEYRK
jgi:hypothetical protein